MIKKIMLFFILLHFLKAQGFNYQNKLTISEKEPNNNFKEALVQIIPAPDKVNRINGVLKGNDRDIFLIYITRPSEIRVYYYPYNNTFIPGIVLYNEYKQYIKLKTDASSFKGEFNSRFIDLKINKKGFYFLKIKNLSKIEGKFKYSIEFFPLETEQKPMKININNLTQNKLHQIFYEDVIKKFKNMQNYNSFRKE